MRERRRYIRLDASLVVRYKILHGKLSEDQTLSKNISSGGICVPLKERIPTGVHLDMEINLPTEKQPIKLIGEVVWQKEIPNERGGLDTGIRYVKINILDRQKITNYILTRLKIKYGEDKQKLLSLPPKKNRLIDILTQEIRLPGDKSKKITLPSFLIKEIKIPGDKTRYAWIESYVKLKYKIADQEIEGKSLSQYISGEGMLILLDKKLPLGVQLELQIELPDSSQPIVATGKIVASQGGIRCSDKEVKVYYDTFIRFTKILPEDRKRIIRYVYSCRLDYIKMIRPPFKALLKTH